jgi:type IV secretion system protein VirB10
MNSWFRRRSERSENAAAQPPSGDVLDAVPWEQGDRGRPAVQSPGSVQAHVSRVLGLGLAALVVGGLVVVYYARLWGQPDARRSAAQQREAQRAQGELNLPPLGSLAALRDAVRRAHAPAPAVPAAAAPVDPALALPLLPSPAAAPPARAASGPRRLSARERAERRLLRSPVFGYHTVALSTAAEGGDMAIESESTPNPDPSNPVPEGSTESESARGSEPRSSTGPAAGVHGLPAAVTASRLPDLTWLIPKGASLDCTLETAIDSTLQGMTTCVTAIDIFGADGRQVVLPRGTQLVGETRGTVRAGQARVQVLWTQARTPDGVVVALESAGTDPLGRAGLPGRVDRQFGERFGAAVLLSIIDGAIQAAVASQQSGSGVYISPSGAPSVMTELLREHASIPPRVVKAQGDRIAILVARDIDFRAAHRSPAGAAHGPADGSSSGGD